MFRKLPIRYKLMLFSLILAWVSILTISTTALHMSEKALKAEAANKLALLRDSRKQAIEQYFAQLIQATELIANLASTKSNLKQLNTIIHDIESSPEATILSDEAKHSLLNYLKIDYSRAYEKTSTKDHKWRHGSINWIQSL